jgi:hypothetical protein
MKKKRLSSERSGLPSEKNRRLTMYEITYTCGKCGIEGAVGLDNSDTLISATLKICEDHYQNSPGCEEAGEHIRITHA